GADVERGVTAAGIAFEDDGVRVHCVDQHGGEELVQAEYLVGAGGAHGPTRGALHEHLEGITYSRRYLVADVRADGIHDARKFLPVAISAVGLLMLAELPDNRTLVVADLPDGGLSSVAPGIGEVRAALAAHLRAPFEISDMRWASMYHTHRRLVPKFSQGRC